MSFSDFMNMEQWNDRPIRSCKALEKRISIQTGCLVWHVLMTSDVKRGQKLNRETTFKT